MGCSENSLWIASTTPAESEMITNFLEFVSLRVDFIQCVKQWIMNSSSAVQAKVMRGIVVVLKVLNCESVPNVRG